MTNLIVNEEFHSIQGEGPNTGLNAYFVRTTGCNLACVWCDAAYTWSFSDKKAAGHNDNKKWDVKEESHPTPIVELFERINESKAQLLVITGGEPLLQQPPISELVRLVLTRIPEMKIEFETAGTIMPIRGLWPNPAVRYNVSPKLANSGNAIKDRFKHDVLSYLTQFDTTAFKFVVSSYSDIEEIEDLCRDVKIPNENVWLMAEGVDSEVLSARYAWLAPLAIKRGYNISPRMHIDLFGNTRAT